MVESALDGWNLNEPDFLFVESVGNLVGPSSYDVGEDLRVVLLSVSEGEDKPLKYPTIFNGADVAVITKMDLAAAAEFNAELTSRNTNAVRPGMQIFSVSGKIGSGISDFLEYLESRRTEARAASVERI
jgi:hydrogenase nickel incorporation protein HypB